LLAKVVVIFVSLLCPAARGGEAGERPWSVGYAEADITPAPGQVQMRGFGRERYAKGALAPLLTQVVALRDQDSHTGVLITADIAGFERVMTEAIRRAITRKHGIPAKNVMLVASHTHWGWWPRIHTGGQRPNSMPLSPPVARTSGTWASWKTRFWPTLTQR